MNINLIIVIIAISWLTLLTAFLVWILIVFRDLIKISKNKEFSNNTKDIKEIKTELKSFINSSTSHIQKVGLVKFNPFKEAGGSNSFSLVLLDGDKNGIIITSLHTRERTRLYLKDVLKGKSKIELSNEEQNALKIANGKNN
jgi:c-di-AMP phosphodiesterase-like protein